ncbi:MAG: aryl-sulfate sulfotransferase [Chloroflexi bacterium]|nr:aryl-sulfate sulfotransferase [Chloroflexota bacterium]
MILQLILIVLFVSLTRADGLTVGLFLNTERAFDGYTLFTPVREGNAYLIDNAGRVVHSWDKGTRGNQTPYLLEDGSVIRVNRGITQHAWDGSLVWDFVYDGPDYLGHHDIEVLPNGNVLLVAKEIKTAAEAIAEGRDPGTLNTGALVSEKIVEVRRTGPTSGEIVWEWRAWDHLIQDFDPTKDNFAVVSDHPELIDINFGETNISNDDSDWLHANSVDYNPELDQIMVSVRQFGELWIIDHSTTTEEAASHSGGRSGMGGGILYRWGNPQAYRAGGVEDQRLFLQHDVQWITPGLPGEGNLLMFNNEAGRPEGPQSSIEEIVPPVDSSGGYPLTLGEPYGPAEPVWSYSNGREFYSSIISGVGRLPNGNTLITSGTSGIIFEVTPDGETVWKYVNPIGRDGPLTQGDPIPTTRFGTLDIGTNQVYRAYRYAPDYPGLAGRDLTPGAVLELPKPTPMVTNTPTVTDSPIATEPPISSPTPVIEPGDVNGDGSISTIDAALILQFDAGLLDSLPYPLSADVNVDGDINSIDAALVLQFTAGLLGTLPA